MKTDNKFLSVVFKMALAVVSCHSSLTALTQEKETCWFLIGLSVIVVGVAVYLLHKKLKKDLAILFLVCSAVVVTFSTVRLINLTKAQERNEVWKTFVNENYVLTKGRYLVENEPEDGPSKMEVAANSFSTRDYITAKEYALKASGDGVVYASQMLIYIYYYGYGTSPDYHEAFKHLINAMKLVPVLDAEELVAGMESKGLSLTARDHMEYEKYLAENKYLRELGDKLIEASEVSRNEARRILKTHHDHLRELASAGSTQAVLFLYMECIEDERVNPKQAKEFNDRKKEYADILYHADFLPTDPYSRGQLFAVLDGPQEYCASNVDYFIKRNVYPELYGFVELSNDLEDKNEFLFAKYRLYRAQYDYNKSVISGERRLNLLLQYQFPYYPETYLNWSRSVLESVINEVQDAMPSLKVEGISDTH